MPAVAATRSVSKFEGRLVTIARAIVRLTPIDTALPLMMEKHPTPAALRTPCLELVCDALANGCVLYLCRIGGWAEDRFFCGDQPMEGRVWQRHSPEDRRLEFSRHALDFLIWITAHNAAQSRSWQPPIDEFTCADHLLLFLAYDALRDTEAGMAWRGRPVFVRNPLCRLHFPDDFARQNGNEPDYSAWVSGLGSAILEVMQAPLADRWLTIEIGKQTITDWTPLRELCQAQDVALDRLLPQLESAGRTDLARFILVASQRYFAQPVAVQRLIGGLQGSGPPRLADRYAIQRSAAVLGRSLQCLAQWKRQAQSVSYLDDGYAAAQFFLAQWEGHDGDSALAGANQLLQQLEPVQVRPKGESDEPGLSRSRS